MAAAAAASLASAPAVAPAAAAQMTRTAYHWRLPPGFPKPRVPPGNPMSDAKVDLGRSLFFDTRLSVTGRYACASCHRPDLQYTDGRARAVGATGAVLARSAMSLINVAYSRTLGWRKPGFGSLETQMRQPMFNEHPIELGLRGAEARLLRELAADAPLVRRFSDAFPGSARPVSMRHLIQAIACFERSLIAGGSAFDRYVFDDDPSALTDSAKRGMALFFSARAGCAACHSGIAFAGRSGFVDTGTGGTFKVPTLRNIALTAPYMHDGRLSDFGAVLAHYEHPDKDAAAGEKLDGRLRPLRLDSSEKHDLIDFLNSLSDLQSVQGGPGASAGTITSDIALH